MQTLEVGPISPQDRQFLARISSVELLREFLGADFPEPAEEGAREWFLSADAADHRALLVIGEVLKATRHESPWYVMQDRKTAEQCLAWANTLWELAEDLPASSYAPYAAWYAGCCYAAAVIRSSNSQDRPLFSEALAREDNFAAADEAFVFAVGRADTYLKPIVLLHRAYLAGFAGQWKKSEGLLTAALDAAPGNDEMRDRGTRLRNDLAKVRARHGVGPRDSSR